MHNKTLNCKVVGESMLRHRPSQVIKTSDFPLEDSDPIAHRQKSEPQPLPYVSFPR